MVTLILVAMGCTTIVLAAHEIMPEWVTTVFAIIALISAGFAAYFDCKRKNEIDELKKKVEYLDSVATRLDKKVYEMENEAATIAINALAKIRNKEEK